MSDYAEMQALLIALEEGGESDRLSDYLAENFLTGELNALARACRAVSWAAHDVANRPLDTKGAERLGSAP